MNKHSEEIKKIKFRGQSSCNIPSCMCCRLRGDVGCASGGTYDTKGLPHGLSDEGETRVEVLRVVHGK